MNSPEPDATVTAGDAFGDLVVVWIDGDAAYIESMHIPGVLFKAFEVSSGRRVGQMAEQRVFFELAANTAAMGELIPVFWEYLLYVPDLISGGPMSVLHEMVEDYLTDKVQERILE
jgi:hypothetical protein